VIVGVGCKLERKEVMSISTILKKAWGMLWQYRALWLFGAVFALVTVNTIFPLDWLARDEQDVEWTKIRVTERSTIKVPGIDMTIDFTAPEGVRISTPHATSWRSFSDMVDELNREVSINLWPLLVEFGVLLVGAIVLGTMIRYIVETALIRMVDETGQTGKRLSLREGLQRGWSKRAWRLFLLDFVLGVLAFVGFIVLFGLAVAPILLSIGSHDAVIIIAGIGTAGLLVMAGCLWLAALVVLSFVLQPIRRACILEDQSLWASIRQGLSLTRHHLKEVGLLWLVWMGIRVLWAPVAAAILIILTPILLLTILLGGVVSGVPAVIIGITARIFMGGLTPWLMGALAGLPIFIVVMISPMLFVSGFVEIYKSCIWTLAYRDLKAMKVSARVPVPQPQGLPASGPAD
jgi:hypothetical protein